VPQNIEFTNDVPISVKVSIRDNGKELLNYSRRNIKPIAINFNRQFYQKGTIVVSPDEIRQVLMRYFSPTTAILQIQPDSLVVEYRKLETRNIPVKLDARITLAHQYVLNENIEIEPSNVAVIGSGQMFDTLSFVKTKLLELHNLKDTVSRVVKLKSMPGLRFVPDEVKVKLLVERFTEKKITVPVTVINCPEHLVLRVFPSQVELSFNVPMSRFSNINVSSVRVLFDFNQLNGDSKTKFNLKIENNEPLIRNLRVSPSEVEYLIEER
jgi:YbbR domain-containing protein